MSTLTAKPESACRKTVLENGIRVITDPMPEVRSLAIGFLIEASPRNETPEQRGLSHLVEHAMFHGTCNRTALEIARMIDAAGGNLGGFTTRDYTCYYAAVLDDYRTYMLDLFGDLVLNSVFPEENLAREKDVVLREIASDRDNPQARAHALLKQTAFPGHVLGCSIPGAPETIGRLTREDVIYFTHANYLPDRLVVAGAGNVDHDDFVAQVRDVLWRMMGQSAVETYPPPAFHSAAALDFAPVAQAYFAVGIEAPRFASRSRYEWHVFNSLLGGGISSRLYRRLREERGLVYSVSSDYQAYRESGILVIEGSAAPEQLSMVLGCVLFELYRLACVEVVSEDELWKVKMQLRGQHLISAESSHTRMARAATQELYFGRHLPGDEVLEQIEAVDLARVHEFAAGLLPSLGRAAIAVVGPESPQYYSAQSLEALLEEFR